jgi:uncharacterized repeat protein (TIGR03803 family)
MKVVPYRIAVAASIGSWLIATAVSAWAGTAAAPPFSTLYGFCATGYSDCADGSTPDGPLLLDKVGNLYGTANLGGSNSLAGPNVEGTGAVFELSPTKKGGYAERVLHSFCEKGGSCVDGSYPVGGVVADPDGNLYGIASEGGAHGGGVVFKLTPNKAHVYTETVLYSFCRLKNCADGSFPYSGVIRDDHGNLYGTTLDGGSHRYGVAFELAPTKKSDIYTETVLHDFCADGGKNCTDGSAPESLIVDASGDLYGVAGGGIKFGGIVFELAKSKTAYQYKVLYPFCSLAKCADGEYPQFGVTMDANGDIYGTTSEGGNHALGTAFELIFDKAKGTYAEKVLYNFCSAGGGKCTDGRYPYSPLTADKAGTLYGTTLDGGVGDGGVVFALTAESGVYHETILHSFCETTLNESCVDGEEPGYALIIDNAGALYGSTFAGGPNGAEYNGGTVFRVTP